MQITTKIGHTNYKEWSIRVHTRKSVYSGLGKFFTSLSLGGHPRSNGVSLITKYTSSEEEACKAHLEIASKAKELFDLVR